MNSKRCEFLIVGSGAGGATLARELSRQSKDVIVVERGAPAKQVGNFKASLTFFDANKLTKVPRKSKEGVILWRTLMAGGSTVVSCGNATRCLEQELGEFGIVLDREFAEAESEMHVAPIAETLLSEGSEAILQASTALGYDMQLMPKFVDADNCKQCGQCIFGCPHHAKWTAVDYLDEAAANGVEILYDTVIDRVLVENESAYGVRGSGPNGAVEIQSDVTILAAGGFGTPVILQRSGIEDAGKGLFIDLLVNTYGVTDGLNLSHEPTMALVDHEFHDERRFILSPYVNHAKMPRFMELGAKGFALSDRNLLGIMTKTADDPAGQVFADGTVSKPVTVDDQARLDDGATIAEEILVKAGADRNSIVTSNPQGAHPGGTAAVGKIVDENLRTRLDNLYVCDSSVLPVAPGLPPILTIVALAKRLARRLTA
ncbi:FAD-dependent oxidoreductase [Candidatus Bipolaricaulota bacterium]